MKYCAACGFWLKNRDDNRTVIHHVKYCPEVTVSIHTKCHNLLHRSSNKKKRKFNSKWSNKQKTLFFVKYFLAANRFKKHKKRFFTWLHPDGKDTRIFHRTRKFKLTMINVLYPFWQIALRQKEEKKRTEAALKEERIERLVKEAELRGEEMEKKLVWANNRKARESADFIMRSVNIKKWAELGRRFREAQTARILAEVRSEVVK